MSFRLRADADSWFKSIVSNDSPIRTKFDQYYLCLMLGFLTGRNDRAINAPEFVDYFVADYASIGRLLVGLLIIVEADRLGIELTEKGDIKRLLSEYLDPNHPTKLSEAGFQKLNDYANGGFSVLCESFPQRPHHVETFLQAYALLTGEKVAESSMWKRYDTAVS